MDNDIDRIRFLLAKYYEADTSPEEEETLARLLATAESLPEDLEADRRLFLALDGCIDGIKVPDALPVSIMEAVDADIAERRRGRRKNFVVRILSAVAAAAVVLILVLAAERDLGLKKTDRDMMMAVSDRYASSHLPDSSHSTGAGAAVVEPELTEFGTVREDRRQAPVRSSKRRQSPRAQANDEVRSLTPEELEMMRAAFITLQQGAELMLQIDDVIVNAGESAREGLDQAVNTISKI